MNKSRFLEITIIIFGSLFLFLPKILLAEKGKSYKIPNIVISEVMWAGSSASTADEWIEFYNTTDKEIDVAGWVLEGATKEDLIFPEGTKISKNGYFLISDHSGDYRYSKGQSVLAIDPDFKSPHDISLSNDNFLLKLYAPDKNDPENRDKWILVDQAGDGEKPFAGLNGTPKASMVRRLPFGAGEQKDFWITADSQYNLDTGVSDLAHPKASAPQISQTTNVVPLTATIYDLDNNPEEDDEIIITSDSASTTLQPQETEEKYYHQYLYQPTIEIKDSSCKLNIPFTVKNKKGVTTSGMFEVTNYQNEGKVRINELLSAPTNKDEEWIELYNFGDKEINLCGWSLDDKVVGSAFKFGGDTKLKPGEYLVLPKSQTGIALNNDTDILTLFNPKGEAYFQTEYKGLKYDESWNFITQQEWQLSTTPTPGKENLITPRPQSQSSKAATKTLSFQGSSEPTPTSSSEISAASSTPKMESVTERAVAENAPILEEEPPTTIVETKIITQKTKFVLSEMPPEIPLLPFEGQVLSATTQKENSFSLFKLNLLVEWIFMAGASAFWGQILWPKKLL